MNLSKKLQLTDRTPVFLVDAPTGLTLNLQTSKKEAGSAVLVFAINSVALAASRDPAIGAAKEGRLSWIAYPKAGQLGTDLNRDELLKLMRPFGIEGVRLVSIDDVWSAMRFRPRRQ